MKIILLIFLFLLSFSANSYCQINDIENTNPQKRFQLFLKNYYSKPDFINNNTYISFCGGIGDIYAPKTKIIDNFQKVYTAELKYGFIRYNSELAVSGIFKHERDYAFISNISSTFKLLDIIPNGIITDSWRFGFGIENGYGYELPNGNPFILLNHNEAISWTHIDFYDYGSASNDENYYKRFDHKFRFGSVWSYGVDIHLTKKVMLSVESQTDIIYPYFKPLEWSGMFIFDNITQRWIDYFEPEAINIFGKSWPLVKFLYKNFISFTVYNSRKNNAYWPFESDKPLCFVNYKAAFSLNL